MSEVGVFVLAKELIKWLFSIFGEEIIILAKEKIQHQWRKMFTNVNVLFLGDKQSGKTALALFIQNDMPYIVTKTGEKIPPNPTLLTAIVDKKYPLQEKNWVRIAQDVPGDEQLRETWRQAVADLRPRGIIYLIDGSRDDSDVQVETACREVFDECYKGSSNELAAFHVFVNFCDKWSTSPQVERRVLSKLRDKLNDELEKRPGFINLRTEVSATQLGIYSQKWDEVKRALHKFGADLM